MSGPLKLSDLRWWDSEDGDLPAVSRATFSLSRSDFIRVALDPEIGGERLVIRDSYEDMVSSYPGTYIIIPVDALSTDPNPGEGPNGD